MFDFLVTCLNLVELVAQWLRALIPKTPTFSSEHPHGGSQPSVSLVPGELTPSSEFQGHQAHTCCVEHTYMQAKTRIHIK